MTRTFAFGLALVLGTSTSLLAEPPNAAAVKAETTEALPSSFFELFGYSMPEAVSKVRKAPAPGIWGRGTTALGSSSSVGFTKTVAETNSTCVTVPVFSAGPSGASLLQAEIVPTAGGSLLKIDFTSSLNLNASGVAFDGSQRDGIAMVCRVWKKTGAAEGTKVACPGMGNFPFLISQVSGFNGSARYWAGHVGQGAYTGLVELSSLSNPSGWTIGTDSIVVDIQVMKAYDQRTNPPNADPVSSACYSNLTLQAN